MSDRERPAFQVQGLKFTNLKPSTLNPTLFYAPTAKVAAFLSNDPLL
jgi:hypothetical protein